MKIVLPFFMMLIAGVVGFAGMQFAKSGFEFDINGGSQAAFASPDKIMKSLSDSEAALNEVYENVDSMSPEEAVKQSISQLERLDSNYASLGKHELDTETERAAQMCVMRSYYLAQTMMPQLKSSFQCQAERVIKLRPESDNAAISRVLLFCSTHDLASDAEPSLLNEISNEAQSYTTKRHGVGLYSIVAHEFWKNGKAESAEKVLKTGISHYRDSSEKLALVNQMIDQGHREPPKPKFTQEQFMRMQRAVSNSSPGTRVRFRS